MTRAELDQLAAETIQAQAETIRKLRARLGMDDPHALPALNSAEEDIKRTPLVADAIKSRLDNPPSPGSSLNTEGYGKLPIGAGVWAPMFDADTKKSSTLNTGVLTHEQEQELNRQIESLRVENKKKGGTLR